MNGKCQIDSKCRLKKGGCVVTVIEKVLAKAGVADADEDAALQLLDVALSGPLRAHSTRLSRLRATLAEVEAQEKVANKEHEEKDERAKAETEAWRKLRGRKPKDPQAALARARSDLAATKAPPPAEPERAELKDAVAEAEQVASAGPAPRLTANITDPESRLMKTKDGWLQGFKVQTAVNADQVVIAYAATQDHNDVAQLIPMEKATLDNANAVSIDEEIGRSL